MPLFEFDCRACAAHFEKLISSNALNSVLCPDCGSADVKKLFSRFGFKSAGGSSTEGSGGSSCGSCSSSSCGSCGAA